MKKAEKSNEERTRESKNTGRLKASKKAGKNNNEAMKEEIRMTETPKQGSPHISKDTPKRRN